MRPLAIAFHPIHVTALHQPPAGLRHSGHCLIGMIPLPACTHRRGGMTYVGLDQCNCAHYVLIGPQQVCVSPNTKKVLSCELPQHI